MDDDWIECGSYAVKYEFESFLVELEDEFGEEFNVRVMRHNLHLLHLDTGEITTFKRHKHQKRWLWGDSRFPGSVPFNHVAEEVARMLFDGDGDCALGFLADVFPTHIANTPTTEGDDVSFTYQDQEYLIRNGQVYDEDNMFVGATRNHQLLRTVALAESISDKG